MVKIGLGGSFHPGRGSKSTLEGSSGAMGTGTASTGALCIVTQRPGAAREIATGRVFATVNFWSPILLKFYFQIATSLNDCILV